MRVAPEDLHVVVEASGVERPIRAQLDPPGPVGDVPREGTSTHLRRPGLGDLVVTQPGEQHVGVESWPPGRNDRVRASEGPDQAEALPLRPLDVGGVRADDVGVLDEAGERLADAALVTGVGLPPFVGQGSTSGEVVGEGGPVHRADDPGDPHVRRTPRVHGEDAAQLVGLRAHRQPGDDRLPPTELGEPLQRREDVLAQRTGGAGVLDVDDLRLEHAGDVSDGAVQAVSRDVEAVVHDHRAGQVELQPERGRGLRLTVDGGDDVGRSHHAPFVP